MSKIVIGISIFTVIVTLSVLYMLNRILTAIKLHTKETQKTVSVVKEVALPVEKIETTQGNTKGDCTEDSKGSCQRSRIDFYASYF